MKHADAMFMELRRREIAGLVNANNRVSVNELCKHFSVTPATIRTDLNEMEKEGALKRTHGGAVSNAVMSEYEPTSLEKESANVLQKQGIARESLKYVKPGDIIGLDTGTTAMELAKLLINFSNLTVVTNDLQISLFLEQNSDITVLTLGGYVRKHFHCTIGKTVTDALSNLYLDTVFLATNGVDITRGLSTPAMEVAEVKRKLIQISKKVILMADSSKIGTNTLAVFGKLDDVDIMITDRAADQEFIRKASEKNVEMICV